MISRTACRTRPGLRAAAWALVLGMACAPVSVAGAADIPTCDADKTLSNVGFQYQFSETQKDPVPGLVKFSGVRETGRGAPPASANLYATDVTRVLEVRYCEGEVAMPGVESEDVYWRIYHVVDRDRLYDTIEHCSGRHDVWQNQCEGYRPDAK